MAATLYDFLPRAGQPSDNDFLLGRFLEFAAGANLQLYPAQEAALLELYEERNVILNTPTGSGKSLVAMALQFKSLAQGKRSVYTCPIKALVNEKWLSLCQQFGDAKRGPVHGAMPRSTATRPSCAARRKSWRTSRWGEGARADVRDVIMDEFHYYADRDRGGAWQVPLLTLPQARFLLMSATLGDVSFFEGELTRLNGRPTVTVRAGERPVPLEYTYAQTPLAQTLEDLLAAHRAPVYVVHSTQAAAAESAQSFTSLPISSRDEKTAIAHALEGHRFTSPYGPEIKRWLRHGIGLHHAGLLPKYRVLVEGLAQRGVAQGDLRDGHPRGRDQRANPHGAFHEALQVRRTENRDLQRAGFSPDQRTRGQEGIRRRGLCRRAGSRARDREFVARTKRQRQEIRAPQAAGKGATSRGTRATFTRLIAAPPERLMPQFQVTHGTLLNVLGRRHEDGCRAMQSLVRRSHGTVKEKKAQFRRAWQLFRALVERKIVEFVPRDAEGVHLQINVGLQRDFSMHQTLSLYLHDTLPLMDPQAPDYALVLLTLAESILEDPDLILRRQLDRLKTQAVAEMKQDGLDYNQRMEELEKLEYPKPNREFVYSTFNAFAEKHPWVGQENIRPKSIAREMFEGVPLVRRLHQNLRTPTR